MITRLAAHEITGLFPEMNPDEYAALKMDVERNGLQEAIWIHEGKIVDGRSRYRACVKLGIKPQLREWSGAGSLLDFVVSANLHRRHMTASQKAMVAVQIEKLLSIAAKENMRAAGGDRRSGMAGTPFQKVVKPIHSAKEAAKMVGANADYVVKAKKVVEQAPDLVPAVVSGAINVREARSLAKISQPRRGAIVEKIATGKAKNVKEARRLVNVEAAKAEAVNWPSKSRPFRLFHDSIENMIDKAQADKLRLIVCDPPYPEKYLPVYESLAKLAAKSLKPGGSLLVMVGHCHLPEILAMMTPHVNYHWTCCYDMPGAKAQVWQRKVSSSWKPVLWFVKGRYEGDWRVDKFRSDRPDKDYHEWGQSVSGMVDIIEKFSKQGDIILDPFLGGGATGVAALRLKRLFVGIDSDEDAVLTSKARIEAFLRQEEAKAA
jgi:16S rRNA G966 N2-methylase RsmD